MRLEFTIPGRPITWQRTNQVKGRRVTDAKQRAAKQAIGLQALSALPKGWPLDASYSVDVIGYWPDRRFGDADRLTSLVMDGLEGAAYKLDRQVVDQRGRVRLDKGNPRTVVVVEVL
jgi:hypothetical protein